MLTVRYEIVFVHLGRDGKPWGAEHAYYRVAQGGLHGTFWPPRQWKSLDMARRWLKLNFYRGRHKLGDRGADFFELHKCDYWNGVSRGAVIVEYIVPHMRSPRQSERVADWLAQGTRAPVLYWPRPKVWR